MIFWEEWSIFTLKFNKYWEVPNDTDLISFITMKINSFTFYEADSPDVVYI